jgi:hypothetical protein
LAVEDGTLVPKLSAAEDIDDETPYTDLNAPMMTLSVSPSGPAYAHVHASEGSKSKEKRMEKNNFEGRGI